MFRNMCLHTANPLDLGYNETVPNHCDYLDYSELNTDKRPGRSELTVMQLNIRGILNKQDALK